MFGHWVSYISFQGYNRGENRLDPGSDIMFMILDKQVHREAL